MGIPQNYLVILRWKSRIMTGVYENDRLAEVFFDDEKNSILGNIYVGKVKNVVKNINAAFVDIGNGQKGYYSLTENTKHFFLNPKKSDALVPGDELLVQVIKEPVKSKPAMLTSNIHLTGQDLVLTANKPAVGISAKITDDSERHHLKTLLESKITAAYGFIARTHAREVKDAALLSEADRLAGEFQELLRRASFTSCFSKLYSAVPSYIQYILSHPGLEKVTTDIPSIYEEICQAIQAGNCSVPVTLYQDESWPLVKVKSLQTQLQRALVPQVWLKSGGFLVIQPTEAMVVIDVNTGRYTGKKAAQDTYFKINMEAAGEIAWQVRLRNLSGIIIIDFIDMKDAGMRRQLFEYLKELVQADPVKTVVVDTTRPNLVEMTRKKERKPLHELMAEPCPKCKGMGFVYDLSDVGGSDE